MRTLVPFFFAAVLSSACTSSVVGTGGSGPTSSDGTGAGGTTPGGGTDTEGGVALLNVNYFSDAQKVTFVLQNHTSQTIKSVESIAIQTGSLDFEVPTAGGCPFEWHLQSGTSSEVLTLTILISGADLASIQGDCNSTYADVSGEPGPDVTITLEGLLESGEKWTAAGSAQD